MKLKPGKKLVIVDDTGKVVAEINPKNIVKRDGKPVFGPNVRQTLTIGEMMSRNLAPSRNKAADMKAEGHPASVELLAA